jgi:predicted aldo/keto reductase-like oxidoreductase
MKRREFLKASALLTAAMAGPPMRVAADPTQSGIKRYQPLGKTGLKMSDISLGCGKLPSPSLVLRAVDRGINYLDTAPDYGRSEAHIGKAMKKIARDKVILASKFCRPKPLGHLRRGSRKADYIAVVEASLARLNTDYLDICFVHSVGSISPELEDEKKRLFDDEMLAAADALKQAGKIRFLAASSHGPHHMEELMMAAVQSGHYDVIMPSFNFMAFPNIPQVLKDAREAVEGAVKKKRPSVSNMELLREAHRRGVGVVAMKTLAGARDLSFESGGVPFQPAAFKWTMNHPEVSGLVVTIKTVSQLDLYLTASGESLKADDRQVLDRYAQRYGRAYCRTGCSACESSCPNGVAIATTLRYQMYFRDYGMEKRGMQSYAALRNNAVPCFDCTRESCAGACPFGLPLRSLLVGAHETLTFTV